MVPKTRFCGIYLKFNKYNTLIKGCGHCKNAKPHITAAAEHFKDDLKIAFIAVDCTKNQPVCDQYNVKGFPTIIRFDNFGKTSYSYEGKFRPV